MPAGKTPGQKKAAVLLVVTNNPVRPHQDHLAAQRAY